MTNRTWVVWQKKSHDDVSAPHLLCSAMEWWFRLYCDLPRFPQMCVLHSFYSSPLSKLPLFLIIVDPNPRTPYVGCYATAASPIIFYLLGAHICVRLGQVISFRHFAQMLSPSIQSC